MGRSGRRWLPRTMRKALVVLVAVSFVPLLLVQGGMVYSWYQSRLSGAEESNLEVARGLAVAVNAFTQDVAREELALGAAVRYLGPGSSDAADRLLAEAASDYPYVRYFAWLDLAGRVLESGETSLVGRDLGDRSYYRDVIGGREVVVSDLLEERARGLLAVAVARAIRDEEGRLLGIMSAVLDPDRLGESLLVAERARGARVEIFDRRGMLVYSLPVLELPMGQRSFRERDPLLRTALEGKEVSGEEVTQPDGQGAAAARVPVPNLGWVAGASHLRREILRPIVSSLAAALVLTLAVAAVSLSLAFAISRELIFDLDLLAWHAEQVGRGELGRRAEVAGIDELERLAESFNRMAAQLRLRTEALERTAQDLALSNRELEQFAYVASHDLQEPLRMIGGYLQLLERRYKGQLDAEADDFIGFAVDGAQRMKTLINDLLSYSRVGTQGRPFEPADSGVALAHALANLRGAIEANGAVVTQDEPLPGVLADPTQLQQLFQNLVGNALKFRAARPPAIHVSARRIDGEWVFAVRDNGIGIDPEYAEQIFVIFRRLHSQIEYPGTGIGLAICKKIVERHGGRIWVESEVGQGSTFHFTLKGTEQGAGFEEQR